MRKTFYLFFISFVAMGYQDYSKVVKQLLEIHKQYPHMTEPVSLGPNDQGTEIIGLKIESPNSYEKKDIKLVVATHHGDEVDAAPLTLKFTHRLLETLDSSVLRRVIDLQDSIYYVFPVLNISGHETVNRREIDASGRWHDPNRDYPDPCISAPFFKLRSIRNLANFVDEKRPSSAITIHGYFGSFTYPWGFFTQDDHTPDHDRFVKDASYATEVNGYRIGTHKEVLYAATGSFEDWAYYTYGTWTMLVEMEQSVDYEADAEMMLRYFSVAPKTRSRDHDHYGSCIKMNAREAFLRSRP